MARKYELKARAERQEETRLRIVEAAIELHRQKGPAHTTFSEIARRAGVQRHTLYRHFPDERAIFLACSALHMERNPVPDARPWREIADSADRLRLGLSELYGFFEQNEDMFSRVVRDAEFHPLTREMFQLRAGAPVATVKEVLAEGLDGPLRLAALDLALDFHTWRRLSASGLSRVDAVETMVAAVLAQ